MMSVGHVLGHVPDHVPDHVSDHMIIGLVATALQKLDVFVIIDLDDILIYTKNEGWGHMKGVQ